MPNAAVKTRSSRSERVDDGAVDMAGLTYAQFVNHLGVASGTHKQSRGHHGNGRGDGSYRGRSHWCWVGFFMESRHALFR
jgi:hypothetical protein